MRIDVPTPDAWGRLSEKFRAALPLKEPALNIQIYAGIGHAVNEITRSLAALYTHKKTIAIVKSVDPSFERVAVAFSQDGFVVKMLSVDEASKAETWAPLIDELLFVLTTEDDPITGRLYPFEAAAFTGKRVFRLHVSHAAHRFQPLKRPDLFAAQILSLAPDRALLVGGERIKIEPAIAPSLFWPEAPSTEIADLLAPQSTYQNEVAEFEATLPAGFRAYFKPNESRLFDRAVIYHPDFDGSAVIDELAATLQIALPAPGQNAKLESMSACRWQSPRLNEWLLGRGETDETTRGLVVIDGSLIDSSLRVHLETAAAKISRLQNG